MVILDIPLASVKHAVYFLTRYGPVVLHSLSTMLFIDTYSTASTIRKVVYASKSKIVDYNHVNDTVVTLNEKGEIFFVDFAYNFERTLSFSFEGSLFAIFLNGNSVLVLSSHNAHLRGYYWKDFADTEITEPKPLDLTLTNNSILAVNKKISQIIKNNYFLMFNTHPSGSVWQIWDLNSSRCVVYATSASESRTTTLAQFIPDRDSVVSITGESIIIWNVKKYLRSNEKRYTQDTMSTNTLTHDDHSISPGVHDESEIKTSKEITFEKQITALFCDKNFIIVGDFQGKISVLFSNGNHCENSVSYAKNSEESFKNLGNIMQEMKKRALQIVRYGRYIICSFANGVIAVFDIFTHYRLALTTCSVNNGYLSDYILNNNKLDLLFVLPSDLQEPQKQVLNLEIDSWEPTKLKESFATLTCSPDTWDSDGFDEILHALKLIASNSMFTRAYKAFVEKSVFFVKEIRRSFRSFNHAIPLFLYTNVIFELDKLNKLISKRSIVSDKIASKKLKQSPIYISRITLQWSLLVSCLLQIAGISSAKKKHPSLIRQDSFVLTDKYSSPSVAQRGSGVSSSSAPSPTVRPVSLSSTVAGPHRFHSLAQPLSPSITSSPSQTPNQISTPTATHPKGTRETRSTSTSAGSGSHSDPLTHEAKENAWKEEKKSISLTENTTTSSSNTSPTMGKPIDPRLNLNAQVQSFSPLKDRFESVRQLDLRRKTRERSKTHYDVAPLSVNQAVSEPVTVNSSIKQATHPQRSTFNAYSEVVSNLTKKRMTNVITLHSFSQNYFTALHACFPHFVVPRVLFTSSSQVEFETLMFFSLGLAKLVYFSHKNALLPMIANAFSNYSPFISLDVPNRRRTSRRSVLVSGLDDRRHSPLLSATQFSTQLMAFNENELNAVKRPQKPKPRKKKKSASRQASSKDESPSPKLTAEQTLAISQPTDLNNSSNSLSHTSEQSHIILPVANRTISRRRAQTIGNEEDAAQFMLSVKINSFSLRTGSNLALFDSNVRLSSPSTDGFSSPTVNATTTENSENSESKELTQTDVPVRRHSKKKRSSDKEKDKDKDKDK